MNSAQQWLDTHTQQSTDYTLLVERLRSGDRVECVVSLPFDAELVTAEFKDRHIFELFSLTTTKDEDYFPFAGENDFIKFCAKNSLVFAQKDFLRDTRRLLEIARNAAEFKAVTVPLNTVEDIDALLALIDGSEQG